MVWEWEWAWEWEWEPTKLQALSFLGQIESKKARGPLSWLLKPVYGVPRSREPRRHEWIERFKMYLA